MREQAAEDTDGLRAAGVSVTLDGAAVLRDITITIHAGEIVGLVGESGAGKSTLAGLLLGRVSHDEGEVSCDGQRLGPSRTSEQKRLVQMVYQDPWASLNPMRTVRSVLDEVIATRRKRIGRGGTNAGQRADASAYDSAKALCALVSLPEALLSRRPSQLSGGQRQRFAIARALAVRPRYLLADEPTSALDAGVRSEIGELLVDVARSQGIGVLLVTHDILALSEVADRIVVLRHGRVVESGGRDGVLRRPAQPYTRSLMDAVPVLRFAPLADARSSNPQNAER